MNVDEPGEILKLVAEKLGSAAVFCVNAPRTSVKVPTLMAAIADTSVVLVPGSSRSPPSGVVIAAFKLIPATESNVSVFALAQLIALLIVMSPGPTVWTPGPLAVVAVVCNVTFAVARLVLMVAAAAASTVKLIGSINHVPVLP